MFAKILGIGLWVAAGILAVWVLSNLTIR